MQNRLTQSVKENFRRWLGIASGPVLGLDISSTSIKLLELSQTGERICVENYGVEPLAPNVVVEREIKDAEAVTQTLQRLLERTKPTAKLVALAVSGSTVITRNLQLARDLSENEILNQIEVEAERYIPYSLEDAYWDFELQGPSLKNPGLVNIIFAAAKKETVDARLDVVSASGLNPKIVDIETLALERAFSVVAGQLPSSIQGEAIAVMDLGATIASLYIIEKGKIIYSREQVFGAQQLTQEIQRRYGLSFEDAIAAKKFGGLPDDYRIEVLEPFKEAVVQQISRALQFFQSSKETSELHCLVLTGGTAALGGLEIMCEERLSLNTRIANPFLNMSLSKRINAPALYADAPGLMVCCGLAMRNFSL